MVKKRDVVSRFFSELGFWEDFVPVTNVISIHSCDSLQIGSGAIAENKSA